MRLEFDECEKCEKSRDIYNCIYICHKPLDALKEFNSYKRLEKRSRLLKLPCAVGDIVYDVVLCDDGEYHIFEMKVCDIDPFGDVRKGKVWNVYLEDDYTKAYRSFYEFGKTVFLTRQAAENALAKTEKKGMEEKIKRILSQLHSAGGCGAQDDYSKGWDKAITEAIRIVEKETSIGIGEVLD